MRAHDYEVGLVRPRRLDDDLERIAERDQHAGTRIRQRGDMERSLVEHRGCLPPVLIDQSRRLIVVDDMQDQQSGLELARQERCPMKGSVGPRRKVCSCKYHSHEWNLSCLFAAPRGHLCAAAAPPAPWLSRTFGAS